MGKLGCSTAFGSYSNHIFSDTEQDFTREAMSNDNVKHIGGLIKANAYLLNALRETAELADYYIPENKGVEWWSNK